MYQNNFLTQMLISTLYFTARDALEELKRRWATWGVIVKDIYLQYPFEFYSRSRSAYRAKTWEGLRARKMLCRTSEERQYPGACLQTVVDKFFLLLNPPGCQWLILTWSMPLVWLCIQYSILVSPSITMLINDSKSVISCRSSIRG